MSLISKNTNPLEISHLVKNYGAVRAVRDVSFNIKPGEIFGLLGPNGAGKTSIISVITSLEKATSGQVCVFGKDVKSSNKIAKSQIGFVPQEIVSHGFFQVQEILKFFSGYYGIKNNQDRVNEVLQRVGLWEHRTKKIPQLSGGMKRRFMIAKALVHQPKLLLLDEPTAGVDIELRASLWEFVRELNQQEGMSIMLTTHYLEEAEELCDRVGILRDGELKKIGPTQSLIKELTMRQVALKLKEGVPSISSNYMIKQSESELVFQIPYKMGVGELLHSLRLDSERIFDIEITEGDLEDVFVSVVGGAGV